MATCTKCGKSYWLTNGKDGMCADCNYLAEKAQRHGKTEADVTERQMIESVMLTTETAAADLHIVSRLGIVSAECAFGMSLFKDIFALGRDIFGGRSSSIQTTLKDARNTALDELRLEAARLGANAVIAVDLDYSEISGGGKSMLFLVATGTAVKLAD